MKKTYYFIRHGQTDLNLKGIVQGKGVDSALNETGLQQAEAFFQAYKATGFDKIYTSTLRRTKQTIQSFVDLGIPVEEHAGFDEISWGIYEGQEQNETIMAGFKELVEGWRAGELDHRVAQGESPNEVVARQKEAIAYLLSKTEEHTVLVCMHGRALRIMLSHLSGTPVNLMDDFPHTNTALYVLTYEAGKFSIIDHYNIEHLED